MVAGHRVHANAGDGGCRLAPQVQRVSDANDQIDTQVDFLNKSIDGLESVDSAEVTTQISDLSTALEAAYAVTNRLSNLSIMDFLK